MLWRFVLKHEKFFLPFCFEVDAINCDHQKLAIGFEFLCIFFSVKELKFSIHLDVYEIVHMAITTIDGLLSYPFGRLEPENALHPDGELYENEFESTVSNDAFLKNGKLILKRSCIMLLSTLAELFPENRSHFEHILDVKTLKEIYHVLRKSYHTDSDYTCRLHAQNGLDEINKAMKSFWVNTNDDSTCKFSNLKVRGLPEL